MVLAAVPATFGFGLSKVTARLLLVTVPLASVREAVRVSVSGELELLASTKVTVTESCPAGMMRLTGPLAKDSVSALMQTYWFAPPPCKASWMDWAVRLEASA